MWAPIVKLMAAAGVPVMQTLATCPPTHLRYVMVDVSAAVQLAPGPTLTTTTAIDVHVRAVFARYDARLGLLAFDTAPNMPLHLPMTSRSQAMEARLPRVSHHQPVVHSPEELDAYADGHCGALDGSPTLQWQWQSRVLLPTLKAQMQTSPPSAWPPLGVILDGVVVEGPDSSSDYAKYTKYEMEKVLARSVDETTRALGNDAGLICRSLLGRTLVNKHEYRRLHLSADAKKCRLLAPTEKQLIPPADAMSKLVRNVAALVLGHADGAPVERTQIVLVSARPDALLHVLLFIDTLRRDLKCAHLRDEYLYVVLPGDVVVDVVAASRLFAGYATRRGFDTHRFLYLHLALARDSDALATALWRSLPAATTTSSSRFLSEDEDEDDDEKELDSFRGPGVDNTTANVQALAEWLARAHRKLLGVTDVVSYHAHLVATPRLAAVLLPDNQWTSHVSRALYACDVFYAKAWQYDGTLFWANVFERAHKAGYVQCEALSPDSIAALARNQDGIRVAFLRRLTDKALMLRYVEVATSPPPKTQLLLPQH